MFLLGEQCWCDHAQGKRLDRVDWHSMFFFAAQSGQRYTMFPLRSWTQRFVIATNLKYKIPIVILLLSTIAYGVWFVDIVSGIVSFVSKPIAIDCCPCGLEMLVAFYLFCLIGPLSLPVMIPAWIIALVLNVRYTTQEPQA